MGRGEGSRNGEIGRFIKTVSEDRASGTDLVMDTTSRMELLTDCTCPFRYRYLV